MASETPFKRPLTLEETLLATPMPQATSTVDRKSSLSRLESIEPIPEGKPEENDNGVKQDYLKGSIDALAMLRDALERAGLNQKSSGNPAINGSMMSASGSSRVTVNTDIAGRAPPPQSNRTSSLGLVDPAEMINLDTDDFLCSTFKSNNAKLPIVKPPSRFRTLDDCTESAERPFELEALTDRYFEMVDFTAKFDEAESENESNEFTALADQDSTEAERTLVREKALRTLNSSNKEPVSTTAPQVSVSDSVNFFDMKSCGLKDNSQFPSSVQIDDQSGFSHILRPSDLDRDEASCVEKYNNAHLTHANFSLSGIELTGSGGSMFMPHNSSLLEELGPADPPKQPRGHQNDETATSEKSISEILDDMSTKKKRDSSDRDTCSSDISVPSIDTLADIIANAPKDIKAKELMKQILSADSSSKSNTSFMSSFNTTMRNDDSMMSSISSSAKSHNTISSEELHRITTIIGCEAFVTVKTGGDFELKANNLEVLAAIMSFDKCSMKVMLVPIKVGTFTVILEEKSTQQQNIKKHIIEITSEQPMIEVNPAEVSFGILPDQCVDRKTIFLKSKNTIAVNLIQVLSGDNCFTCDEKFSDSVICLMPGEVMKKEIVFHTPELDNSTPKKEYRAEFRFIVKSCDEMKAEIIAGRAIVTGGVAKGKLQLQKSASFNQSYSANETRAFSVINDSEIPINILIRVLPSQEFKVPYDSYTISPKSKFKLEVTYTPTASRPVDGTLCMRIMPSGTAYKIPLKGGVLPLSSAESVQSLFPNHSPAVSESSRSSSPNVAGLPLSLESTCKFLVWASVARCYHIKRSFSLRNNAGHREKLIIKIVEPSNSFFFEIEGEQKREMKITLDGMQTKEITVTLTPAILGPLRGSIVITRMKKDNEKKMIGLLGFGGKGLIRMDSLFVYLSPNESQLQLLVLDNSLSTNFSLHNIGDGQSYFLIFQSYMEATYINATPNVGTIAPGSSQKISVSFRGDPASIKTLLNRSKCLEIKLCTLLIVHGDDPTRLRLLRLCKKYGKTNDNDPSVKHIMDELRRIVKAFSGQREVDDTLKEFKDPLSALHYLYNESIYRSQIDVVVNRRALEEADLDSTVQFTNLDNTLADVTAMTTTNFNINDLNASESNSIRLESWIAPDNTATREMFNITDQSFTTPVNKYSKPHRLDRTNKESKKNCNMNLI